MNFRDTVTHWRAIELLDKMRRLRAQCVAAKLDELRRMRTQAPAPRLAAEVVRDRAPMAKAVNPCSGCDLLAVLGPCATRGCAARVHRVRNGGFVHCASCRTYTDERRWRRLARV